MDIEDRLKPWTRWRKELNMISGIWKTGASYWISGLFSKQHLCSLSWIKTPFNYMAIKKKPLEAKPKMEDILKSVQICFFFILLLLCLPNTLKAQYQPVDPLYRDWIRQKVSEDSIQPGMGYWPLDPLT